MNQFFQFDISRTVFQTLPLNLFVLLHGTHFMIIQLDEISDPLSHFPERLEVDGNAVEERECVMSS